MRLSLVLFLFAISVRPALSVDTIWQPDAQWNRSKAMIDQFTKP